MGWFGGDDGTPPPTPSSADLKNPSRGARAPGHTPGPADTILGPAIPRVDPTAVLNPPPPTTELLAKGITAGQDAAAKQRKRAAAGSTLLGPVSGPDLSPGPRLNKLTLVGH